MTVENQRNKKRFEGDGVTDTVTFSFRVLAATDIKVYVYPEDLDFADLEAYLVDPNDYTVTLDEDGEGGEIVFDPGAIPAADEIGLILNELALTQTADLPTEGNFNEESVETALDRVVLQNIQQQERVNRGLALSVEDPLADDDFEGFYIEAVQPEDRAGRIAQFNAAGDGVEAGIVVEDLGIISGIADEIVIVAGIASEVEAVAAIDGEITTVATDISNVNTVAVNIADVNTVAGISVAVQDVAAIDTEIVALSLLTAEIAGLYAIAADISAVAAIDTDVSAVAAISADVQTVADNIVDIQNAEENADLAEKWATEAEDVEVQPGLYSAFHWAQKAQEFAEGQADNISFDPTGTGLTATNVQDAIEELDSVTYTQAEVDDLLENLPGRILQFQEGILTSTASDSISTGTPVALGPTVSVTPAKIGNKIEVEFNFNLTLTTTTALYYHIYKNGSKLSKYQGAAAGSRQQITGWEAGVANNNPVTIMGSFVDEAANTSAATYEIRFSANQSGTVYINRTNSDTDSAPFARAASWIKAKEISQ